MWRTERLADRILILSALIKWGLLLPTLSMGSFPAGHVKHVPWMVQCWLLVKYSVSVTPSKESGPQRQWISGSALTRRHKNVLYIYKVMRIRQIHCYLSNKINKLWVHSEYVVMMLQQQSFLNGKMSSAVPAPEGRKLLCSLLPQLQKLVCFFLDSATTNRLGSKLMFS